MTDLAVIMSVYKKDRLKFLKESIESILTQTYKNFHYYISFDGPVSQEIDKYVTTLNDSRIRLIRLGENSGLAKALNFLLEGVLKNPGYKFIARMDADDISLPYRFEKQHDFLVNNPEISIVGCWYRESDEAGQLISVRRLPVQYDALKKLYYTRSPFAHPSVMFRRSMVEAAGMYPTDTILMEDNVLWGRALMAGLRLANIPEYLFIFRKDKNFYKRRSGLKYGWRFIIIRFRINRSLNAPVFTYLLIFLLGIIKMLPPSIHRHIYAAARAF